MSLLEKWNKKRFSVYDSEEKSTLELMEKLSSFIKEEVIKEVDNKVSQGGDFLGTWQGIAFPTLSEEGLRGTVETLVGTINNIKTNYLRVNVKEFGAKGDGVTDDTLSIQNAINSISYGVVFFPKGKYLVSELTIPKGGIYLEGELNGNTDTNSSTIYTNSTLSSELIKVGVDNDRVYGGGLKNINIFAKKYEHTTLDNMTTQPLNRKAITVKQLSFYNIENCTIYGFVKGGIDFDGCYDCSINNLEVCWCGSPSFPAVNISKTNEYVDNSNAIKFVNCKFEFSAFLLNMDICRNIVFSNCKFEGGTVTDYNTTLPTILTSFNTGEVSFDNCMLSVNPDHYYMIEFNSKLNTITNCQLVSDNGSKWVNCQNGNMIFVNNIVKYAKNNSFALGNVSTFKDNKIYTNSSTEQSIISCGYSNRIKDNDLIEVNTPTSGNYISFLGENNEIEGNIENGTIYNLCNILIKPNNKVKRFRTLTTNAETPNVMGIDVIIFDTTTDINVTNFVGGYEGQVLTCLTNNNPTRTTIVNNSNIVTSTGANLGLLTSKPINFLYSGGIWFKIV